MSKFYPQIEDEVAQQGYTHEFDFAYTDIPAGLANAAAQVFLLPKVIAGDEVIELGVRLLTPFTGGGNTTVALDIGDDVSPTTYATALAVGAALGFQHIADKNNVYTAPHQLQIRLTPAAGASLSNLTA